MWFQDNKQASGAAAPATDGAPKKAYWPGEEDDGGKTASKLQPRKQDGKVTTRTCQDSLAF